MGEVISFDSSNNLYLLRYDNAPPATDVDGRDEEQVSYQTALSRISDFDERIDSDHEEDDYMPPRRFVDVHEDSSDDDDDFLECIDSPLRVDATSTSTPSLIAPDDHHSPDEDQVFDEPFDHAMEEEELDLSEGMVLQEGVTQEGDKRSVYPQWGSAGRFGNAQSKRFSKVDINFEDYGNRATHVCNHRCTDIAQMYSPQTKYCCNKPSNLGYFSHLWKLPFLMLSALSSFYLAILTAVQTVTKESSTVPFLFEKISLLAQSLEDCSSRVTNSTQIYARLEFTIAIDHATILDEAPPLPIVAHTCPLPALELVESAVFKHSFCSLVALVITPLRHITRSVSHFKDAIDFVSPKGKASLMCCVEMGQNILGGGGGGKASLVGNLLTAQRGTGHYNYNYLAPLKTDLIKLSKKDHQLTGLCFGLSEQLAGFQVVTAESGAGEDQFNFEVTSNRSTVIQFSKSLKCPESFLDCLQRILVLMSGGLRGGGRAACVQDGISFLQPLSFDHIAAYNRVQVTQLIGSVAGLVVRLYRHEWAAILAPLFADPPFTILLSGVPTRVHTRSELESLLATIRSTEDLATTFSALAVHRKKPVETAIHLPEVNTGGECRFVICFRLFCAAAS